MACVCKAAGGRSVRRHLVLVLDGDPRTLAGLRRLMVARFGCAFGPEVVRRALGSLLDAGLAERLDLGPGRPALWLAAGGLRRADGRPELVLLRGGAA